MNSLQINEPAKILRPFIVPNISPAFYHNDPYSFTGLFELSDFSPVIDKLRGHINVVSISLAARDDPPEFVFGREVQSKFHHVMVQFVPDDQDLYRFCLDQTDKVCGNFVPGKLCAVFCKCDSCQENNCKMLYRFLKDFDFGDSGFFTDGGNGPRAGVTILLAGDGPMANYISPPVEFAIAMLEGLSARRRSSICGQIGPVNISDVDLFGKFSFSEKCATADLVLTKVAYLELMEIYREMIESGMVAKFRYIVRRNLFEICGRQQNQNLEDGYVLHQDAVGAMLRWVSKFAWSGLVTKHYFDIYMGDGPGTSADLTSGQSGSGAK